VVEEEGLGAGMAQAAAARARERERRRRHEEEWGLEGETHGDSRVAARVSSMGRVEIFPRSSATRPTEANLTRSY
jgi:hypothetical protein